MFHLISSLISLAHISDSGPTELPVLFLVHTHFWIFHLSSIHAPVGHCPPQLPPVYYILHYSKLLEALQYARLPLASGPLQRLGLLPGMLPSASNSLLLLLGTIP